jgi:hypothetical protein
VRRKRNKALAIACALAPAALAVPASALALCADLSGDGHVTARDALGALKLAVAAGYDAAADVFPAQFDGAITASDARVVLMSAAASALPRCAAGGERTVVLTTASCDFVTGGIAEVDIASRDLLRHRPGVTAADAVVRKHDDRVFVLNRFGSNTVLEIDPDGALDVLWECSVGSGANPHDIVLVGPAKGYVTRFDSTKLAIVDPSAGPGGCEGFLTGTIDLSAWADDDGFPEMDQMVLVGDVLWVSIQRLNRNSFFRPGGFGALLAIDTTTDQVVHSIELSIQNPLVETKGIYRDPRSGLIWVAGPGLLFADLTDGGIELVDPEARSSLGIIATGADLGGDLTDLVVVGSARAYAIVATEDFAVQLVEVDLANRRRGAVLAENDSQMSDVEMTEGGELWLADRNCFDPGLRVFSVADNAELTTAPIDTVLAPFSLEFLR